jgi:hypothetical protein
VASFQAIAGVSRTLRRLLLDRIEAPGPLVTIAPPDVHVDGAIGRRVNLYLYQIGENGHLKNQELPGAAHPNEYGHPPLALELHYLVTAYGETEASPDADLQAQMALGDAMLVLHDFPIVDEDLLVTRPAAGTVGDPILDAVLQNEFEQVKICLEPAGVDELAKIWTALPQANFRRSVSYQVSVVQLESRRARRAALPVRTRRVHVGTLRRPRIADAFRTPAPGGPPGDARVAILQELTILGSGFTGLETRVKLGAADPIVVTPLGDGEIHVTVPDDPRLQPGPLVLQVLVTRDGEAVEGALDTGIVVPSPQVQRSNQTVVTLVPGVTTATADATLITVLGRRLFQPGLRSFVVVGEVSIEVRRPRGADPWAEPTETSVQVPRAPLAAAVPPIVGGTHPLRIVVNGAQNIEGPVDVVLP